MFNHLYKDLLVVAMMQDAIQFPARIVNVFTVLLGCIGCVLYILGVRYWRYSKQQNRFNVLHVILIAPFIGACCYLALVTNSMPASWEGRWPIAAMVIVFSAWLITSLSMKTCRSFLTLGVGIVSGFIVAVLSVCFAMPSAYLLFLPGSELLKEAEILCLLCSCCLTPTLLVIGMTLHNESIDLEKEI